MEQTIQKIIRNWVRVKNNIPRLNNRPTDPRYHDKFLLLVKGEESLGDQSYDEWSEDIEIRLADKFKKMPLFHNPEFCSPTDSLLRLINQMALGNNADTAQYGLGNTDMDFEKPYALAVETLTQLIDVLDGINMPKSRKLKEIHLVKAVTKSSMGTATYLNLVIYAVIGNYLDAVKAAAQGNSGPLNLLCLTTFKILNDYRDFSIHEGIQRAKGNQQRSAARIKNKPSRETKEYAISLYEKKTWDSPRAASLKILDLVRDYGKNVGFHFTDNFAAQTRIYSWLLAHKKDNP